MCWLVSPIIYFHDLPQELQDVDTGDGSISRSIDPLESSMWLEFWQCSEFLPLCLQNLFTSLESDQKLLEKQDHRVSKPTRTLVDSHSSNSFGILRSCCQNC